LLDADALLAVTHFYFRLDALVEAIESLCAVYERHEASADGLLVLSVDQWRVTRIVNRLRSCFEPALTALEKLDVPGWQGFDEAVTRQYPHLRKSRRTLRQALTEYAPDDLPASKGS
jgi:hypothetical protein